MSGISNFGISDEELMAYADGELPHDRHGQIAAIVAEHPEAAERLAVFAATGRRLSGLFEQPMLEAVPQRLVDAARGHGDRSGRSAPASGNVVDLASRRRARPAASQKLLLQAAAACVALVIAGLGAKNLLDSRNEPVSADNALAAAVAASGDGVNLAGGELAAALDVTPSGSSAVRAIAGHTATIKPVFTFASLSGGYCRQYTISSSDAVASYAGVACREAAGRWRVEAHEPVGAAGKEKQIVVAGKGGMAAVDAVVDKLISGSVFGADEEAAAINGKWQAVKP